MQKRCVTFLQGDATSTVVLVDARKELVQSSLSGLTLSALVYAAGRIVFARNMIWFLSLQASVNGFGFSVLKGRL